jgi:hypothetical protein
MRASEAVRFVRVRHHRGLLSDCQKLHSPIAMRTNERVHFEDFPDQALRGALHAARLSSVSQSFLEWLSDWGCLFFANEHNRRAISVQGKRARYAYDDTAKKRAFP